MNKIFKYQIIFVVFCLTALFTACDDWTDTEGIDIIEADIEKDNPELYQKYLANLRAYRDTDHKLTLIQFNNTQDTPASRGERLNAVPDSVDIINLKNPDELSTWVTADMEMLRKDKGMQFVFTIGYPDIEAAYEQYLSSKPAEEDDVEGEPVDEFLAFAGNYIEEKLALVDKYNYDGIAATFYGMNSSHLTEAEKTTYLAREEAFMSKMSMWISANPEKLFIYEGSPQFLTDKSILQAAKVIVLRTELLKFASSLEFEVLLTLNNEVPNDRYVVTVNAKSFEDERQGYYTDGNNQLVSCIPLAAEWVDTYNARYTKAGLYILDAQNDYYNAGNSYQSIREAISTMNLSPKI